MSIGFRESLGAEQLHNTFPLHIEVMDRVDLHEETVREAIGDQAEDSESTFCSVLDTDTGDHRGKRHLQKWALIR